MTRDTLCSSAVNTCLSEKDFNPSRRLVAAVGGLTSADIEAYVNHLMDTLEVALLSQRGRAMLCMTVVSFNSTRPRAQSFIISYFGFSCALSSLL